MNRGKPVKYAIGDKGGVYIPPNWCGNEFDFYQNAVVIKLKPLTVVFLTSGDIRVISPRQWHGEAYYG